MATDASRHVFLYRSQNLIFLLWISFLLGHWSYDKVQTAGYGHFK